MARTARQPATAPPEPAADRAASPDPTPASLHGVRVGAVFEDLSPSAQIREVALRLFAERGIAATSIRAVAAAAGVSAGAVMHHFPTKAALEQAVHASVSKRVIDAVHGVGTTDPLADALTNRRDAWEGLLRDQPHLADYIRRVLAEDGEQSIAYFKQSLASLYDEMAAMTEAGLARQLDDPEVGIALYWMLVSARVLLRPQLEAALGLDLSDPADIERLHRAEIDLLTKPLFPGQDATA